MWYMISQLWLFLLVAVLVGFYVGWSTAGNGKIS
jgi:hypothetical protein